MNYIQETILTTSKLKINNFGIITPSYAPDFQRCQLLCHSIDKFLSPSVNHYIIVDQKDLLLFRQLERANRQIITKESILPWWIKRLPTHKNLWFSFKTLPIRGWLIQQIIKIAVAQQIPEEISIFVDSDVVFVRPFNLNNFIKNNQVRLFRETVGNKVQKKIQYKWHKVASHLLALPDVDNQIPDYIGQIVTWKKSHVIQLCNYLEQRWGKSWLEILANSWHCSEYTLYGIFVERILKEKSEHYYDCQLISHDYWDPVFLSELQLEKFIQQIRPEQIAIMISAKAKISPQSYQSIIEKNFSLTTIR
ncbi:hypothetical protein STA3757_17880 [Stanieria sp. NIES-3757]|nr:hypothetical protein STA3757_17880 [Stanieria sp. NIES-3757]